MNAVLPALLFIISVAAQADTLRLSAPVVTTEDTETFGARLDTSLPEVSMSALVESPQKYLDNPFRVSTRVAKVCQKKGCFFIAQSGDDILRVSFRDYGFFIPTDSSGKTVTLTGQLVKKTISKEVAAHYREDLNTEEANIHEGVVYEIVADSVRIPLRG